MKNIAMNTIKYTGIVTLSQYIGNKKIQVAQVHNRGENPLFNFLTDCLAGNWDVAEQERPTKIMLLNSTFGEAIVGNKVYKTVDYVESASNGFIYTITKPEKLNASKIRYSFVIQREVLENATFNSIGLYNNSTIDIENYAAFCEIDIDKNKISPTAMLVIDWELTISNYNI